jgi:hypothetical protein
MGFEDDLIGAPHSAEQQLSKKMIPLAKLELKLFKHLQSIVEMAAYMDPEIVANGLQCESFDGLITLRMKQLHVSSMDENEHTVDLADKYK